jgi:hypothetical protein
MDTQTKNDDLIQKYIQSLTAIELKAYVIAKTHLQSSFSIEKSIGFIEWRTKYH